MAWAKDTTLAGTLRPWPPNDSDQGCLEGIAVIGWARKIWDCDVGQVQTTQGRGDRVPEGWHPGSLGPPCRAGLWQGRGSYKVMVGAQGAP